MSSQKIDNAASALNINSSYTQTHEEAVTVDGFEDIFKWAQDMVSDGEDVRAKRAREQKIRRRVLELVQSAKDQKQNKRAQDEITYLQRRVIALLQKVTEVVEESSSLKQTVVAQQLGLSKLPELEVEVKRLKAIEIDRQKVEQTQSDLLTVLSKVKKDRDFLEELVVINEQENSRLSYLYRESREKLEILQARRWWHWFIGR